jgi:hypothetical protein
MASRIQEVAVTVAAVGSVSPWIKHDIDQDPFDVTLSVFFDSVLNGDATLAVQYIADDQSRTGERPVRISAAGTTTVTVTDYGRWTINGGPANASWGGPFGHGLLTGDVVWLEGTQLGIDSGLQPYTVTVTGVDTYTVTVGTALTFTNVQALVTSGRVLTHSTLTALTARATGSYIAPVWASRLICTAFTSGGVAYLVALQGR